MVPVNEVTNEGQPQLFIGNLPPRLERRRAADHPAADLLRRAAQRLRRRRRPAGRVRLPDRRGRRGGVDRDRRRAGPARPASSSTTTLMRLLFALRFRDLDLLISDQVTADSQLLFHRSLSDRLERDRAVPAASTRTRTSSSTTAAGWSTSRTPTRRRDRFPNAQAVRPAGALDATGLGGDDFNYIRNSVKITMDAYDGTMHFYVADPADPIIRAYAGVFPTLFEPLDADARRPRAPTCACPRSCSTSRPGCSGVPRDGPAAVLPRRRPVDRADGPRRASRPCRPRPTTS